MSSVSSSSRLADAVHGRSDPGVTQASRLPRRVLRGVPRRLASRRLDPCSPRAAARVITGRSDATLKRGGVRLGTSEFYAGSRGWTRSPTAWSSTWRSRRSSSSSSSYAEARRLDDDLRADRGGAPRASAATRTRQDRCPVAHPADPLRQEARGAGQADPHRRSLGRGRQHRRAREPRLDGAGPCLRTHASATRLTERFTVAAGSRHGSHCRCGAAVGVAVPRRR